MGGNFSCASGATVSDRFLAIAGVILVFGLTLALLYVARMGDAVPVIGYDGQPLSSAISAAGEKRAHLFCVIATAIICLLIIFWPASLKSGAVPAQSTTSGFFKFLVAALVCVVAAVTVYHPLIISASTTQPLLFLDEYGLRTILSPITYYVAGGVCVVVFLVAAFFEFRSASTIIWCAIILYAICISAPGFLVPLRLDRLPHGSVQGIFWHYDAVFGPKLMLGRGQVPNDLGYGLGLNAFAAVWERLFGLFSFAADIRFVQVGNVVYSALTLMVCALYFRARPVFALIAVMLVLPWVQTLHQGIFFPNQTGWRFLFFPIAFIAIRLAANAQQGWRDAVLGFIAGASLLWNAETGFALAAGLFVYVGSRIPVLTPRSIVVTSLIFLTGALLSVLCLDVFLRLAFGSAVPLRELVNYFTTRAGLSYGAHPTLDPMAIAIFAGSLWAILLGATLRRRGEVPVRAAEGMALGTTILLWAGYYFLQPDPWNQWSYFLPASLLVAVCWPPRVDGDQYSRPSVVVLLSAMGLGLTVGPVLLGSQLQAGLSINRALSSGPLPDNVGYASGVAINDADAEASTLRLAGLQELPNNVAILTGDTYVLPKLSGQRDKFWLPDPAFRNTVLSDFASLIEKLLKRRPEFIYFDAPDGMAADDKRRAMFARIRQLLEPDYVRSEDRPGWIVMRRSDS